MHHTTPTSIIFGLAFASFSLAQTSILNLYIPDTDPQPLVASVIASDATATTYALQCVPGTDSNDCGFPGVVTLTEGPATAAYTFPAQMDENNTLAFTGYMDCSLAGTTSAVCVESFGGYEANFPGMSTETVTDLTYIPVTITAGLKAGTGGSTTGVVASTTPASSSVGGKSSGGSKTGTGTGTETGSGSGSGSGVAQATSSKGATSTAGMPAVTGNARWVLGGAAVALAMMG